MHMFRNTKMVILHIIRYALLNGTRSSCFYCTLSIPHLQNLINRITGSASWWVLSHDDVINWKHFQRYWPICEGDPPVTGELHSQKPMTRSIDVFFDRRLNKQLSYRDAGDLKRHRIHDDDNVMVSLHCNWIDIYIIVDYRSLLILFILNFVFVVAYEML